MSTLMSLDHETLALVSGAGTDWRLVRQGAVSGAAVYGAVGAGIGAFAGATTSAGILSLPGAAVGGVVGAGIGAVTGAVTTWAMQRYAP